MAAMVAPALWFAAAVCGALFLKIALVDGGSLRRQATVGGHVTSSQVRAWMLKGSLVAGTAVLCGILAVGFPVQYQQGATIAIGYVGLAALCAVGGGSGAAVRMWFTAKYWSLPSPSVPATVNPARAEQADQADGQTR